MLLSLEELFGFLSPSMNLNNFNQIRNDIIQDYLTDLSMPSLYSWPLASLLRCLLSIEKIFPPPKITRLRLNLINYRFFLVTFILVCSVRIHEDFIKLLQRRIHLRHVTLYLKKITNSCFVRVILNKDEQNLSLSSKLTVFGTTKI